MKNISRSEWRWVILFAAVVMLVTSVPYAVGALRANDDWRFSGFVFGVEDGNSYLAKMQLGARGLWLFRFSYAIEGHPPALVYPFFILLGKITGALVGVDDPLRLHASLVVAYHLARLMFGAGLIGVSYVFVAQILPQVRQRRYATILIALGGGFGWLLTVLQMPGTPLEFYSPEAFGFLHLFGLPHLAAARLAMLAGFLFYLSAIGGNWRWLLAAAAAWFGMTLVQPFYMLIVFIALALHVAVLAALALRQSEASAAQPDYGAVAVRVLWIAVASGAAGVPMVVYTFILFAVEPVYATWGAQNVLTSPPVYHYLSAWGLLAIPAVWGLRVLYRRNMILFALLMGWLASTPLLVYAPYNLQRRFAEGVFVPLASLAVLGITTLVGNYRKPILRFAPAALVALTLPTTGLLWAGGLNNALGFVEPVFQSREQVKAYAFMADNLPPRAVILSSYLVGNAAPAYANVVSYVGHGPETPNLRAKLQAVNEFYSHTLPASFRFATYSIIGAPYVVIGPFEHSIGEFDPSDSRQANYLNKIYDSGVYTIWALKAGG